MERWKQLKADLEAWGSRLSPRERVMVTLAGVAVVLFVVVMVSFRLQAGVRARELRIEEGAVEQARLPGAPVDGHGRRLLSP